MNKEEGISLCLTVVTMVVWWLIPLHLIWYVVSLVFTYLIYVVCLFQSPIALVWRWLAVKKYQWWFVVCPTSLPKSLKELFMLFSNFFFRVLSFDCVSGWSVYSSKFTSNFFSLAIILVIYLVWNLISFSILFIFDVWILTLSSIIFRLSLLLVWILLRLHRWYQIYMMG